MSRINDYQKGGRIVMQKNVLVDRAVEIETRDPPACRVQFHLVNLVAKIAF